MKVTLITIIITLCFIFPCAAAQCDQAPQEVVIKIQGDAVQTEQENGGIVKSMVVDNPNGELSHQTFISGGKAFIKLFSSLSTVDVTLFWSDLCVLEHDTEVRDVDLYINSPGGDAFSGLALADQVERAKRRGFKITAYASGIIASAAVPVLAVCDVRIAAPGTIFMVHEASLWKWPGRETASNIRSQGELMGLLQDRYLGKLANNSNLSIEELKIMEVRTTWFDSEQALEWGLVDKIE